MSVPDYIIKYIGDYEERARKMLLSINRSKPRIVALTQSLAAATQVLEDITFDLIVSRRVENSSGANLDLWGSVVGSERRGLDDEAYRNFILAQIKANLSSGTRDEIIEIFQIITGAVEVRYFDAFPAAYALVAYVREPLTDIQRERIREMMDSVRPGGVDIHLIEATENAFRYDSGPGYDSGVYSRTL